jgi:predicted metallopeptidase
MAAEYEVSERVEEIAKDLIKVHHIHLASAKIAYLMKLTPRDKDGRIAIQAPQRIGKRKAIGTARNVPAIYYTLTGFDFIIEIDEYRWDILTIEQQIALVDHELCHCARDPKGFYIKDHDVEEFCAIVERHGAWRSDLVKMREAFQMVLPMETPTGESAQPSVQ